MGIEMKLRVAVVVPFHSEPLEQLERCVESVAAQTYPCELVMVSDGGRPYTPPGYARLLPLPQAHGDFGNCARAIGAIDAISTGADAVAFLDADNWLHPEHIARMVALHEASKAPICTASVTLVRVDGSVMPIASENDGKRHVDTSAIFVTREAFALLPLWALVPKELAQMGDRVWWQLAKSSGFPRAHCAEPTVFYRTRYAAMYRALGEPLPADAKEMEELPPGLYQVRVPAMGASFQVHARAAEPAK